MTGILASTSYYCRNVEVMNQCRTADNFAFSKSVSRRVAKSGRKLPALSVAKNDFRFRVEMQQGEPLAPAEVNGQPVITNSPMRSGVNRQDDSSKPSRNSGINGQAINSEIPTRFRREVTMVPASEMVKNKSVTLKKLKGSLVKRDTSPHVVETPRFQGLQLEEEVKVLLSDEAFNWANESYNSWKRTIDIWSFVIFLWIRILLDDAKWTYLGGFTDEKQKKRRQNNAVWLRERILDLGPTFIKVGQYLSARSDLFPEEFVKELAKLQDRVPAFSPGKAKNLIKSELGAPVDILFKDFEDQPIAAASLGQVHRAILHNGEQVVVKVQRPALKKLFDIDLGNLKLAAEYFHNNDILGGPIRDWIAIYKECAKILYQEIDYINEGQNADRLRRDFRNIKWVRVPLVYWDYTSRKVLTLEYVPGTKINNLKELDSKGYNRSRISTLASEAYLIQILKTGFFHADPHPGNLAIDADEALIYYDYGMMGEIESFSQERLLALFYALYEKDSNKVMESLIELGTLQPTGDLSSVRRTVQFFLDNSLTQKPNQQQTFAAIGEDLFSIAQDQPFRFPTTFALVLRAFTTLEGLGYTIDPDYSFLKIATPYVQELLDIRQKQQTGIQLVQEISKQADDARASTVSMPYRVEQIEKFMKQLELGDIKIRARVLESERAARKSEFLQMATMYTVLGGTLLNLGVTLSSQGSQLIAKGSFLGAGVFLILFISSIQRVKKLDKFENMA